MKLQLTFLSLATILFSSPSIAAPVVVGSWNLKARECMSGSVPKEAFVVGRDHLEIKIVKTALSENSDFRLEGEIRIGTKIEIFKSKIHSRGIAFDSVNPITGKRDLMLFNQPADDTLQVFTAGFGDNDTCPKADLLKTTYSRVRPNPVPKREIRVTLQGLM